METRLKNYLETWMPRIDEEMYRFLPKNKDPVDFLYAPMRDYPQRGGKRFRSALVLLGIEAFGGDPMWGCTRLLLLSCFSPLLWYTTILRMPL